MSFDRLAPHYDWMEAVTSGGLLQRVRTAWLDELEDCRDILSAGEGHGRFAAACAARFPEVRLTCVEASAKMLAKARKRCGRVPPPCASINWIQAALPRWAPPGAAFDAIATCFFLDCFDARSLERVVASLARAAKPRARWLVADFALPPRGPKRWRARGIHAAMYAFFRVAARLPARRWTPPDTLLRAHGFRLAKRREFDWGLLRAEMWERGNG